MNEWDREIDRQTDIIVGKVNRLEKRGEKDQEQDGKSQGGKRERQKPRNCPYYNNDAEI